MVKIVVVDNYGTQNNGVMAMGIAFITRLKEMYPNCEIIFYSDYKYFEIDKKRYAPCCVSVQKMFWLLKIFPGKLTQPLVSIFVLLVAFISAQFKIRILSRTLSPFINANAIVSLCGEDLLSDHCHWQLLLCEYIPFLLARIYSKPYVVFAQTIGPFNRRISKWLFAKLLSSAQLVTVREPISWDLLLSSFGHVILRNRDIFLTGDIAFLMKPATNIEIHSKEAIDLWTERPNSKFLGISVSYLFATAVFQGISSHKTRHEAFVDVMAQFCDFVVEKYSFDIVFVPHVTVFNGDDRVIAADIRKRVKNKNKVHVLLQENSANVIKAIVGQCSFFIGCRMHALVAAVSQSIPSIALAYSYKTLGVIGPLIDKELVIDVRKMPPDEFEKCIKKTFSYLVQKRNTIQSQISMKLPGQIESSEKNFTLLARVI